MKIVIIVMCCDVDSRSMAIDVNEAYPTGIAVSNGRCQRGAIRSLCILCRVLMQN